MVICGDCEGRSDESRKKKVEEGRRNWNLDVCMGGRRDD